MEAKKKSISASTKGAIGEFVFFLFPSLFHDLEYLEYVCMCKLQFEKTATEKKLVYALKIIFSLFAWTMTMMSGAFKYI